MEDPMEAIVAQALTAAGVGYLRDLGGENPSGLDFRLHDGVEIEVKRFHTPRIAEQMARAENVIALQGKAAVEHYTALHTALTAAQAEIAALTHDLTQSMDICTDYVNRCAALEAEIAALREQVEAAYREGYRQGANDTPNHLVEGDAWRCSQANAALSERQP